MTTNPTLAVVWMDHALARVIRFDAETSDATVVHASDAHPHVHHRRGTIGAGKAPEDIAFFERVGKALEGVGHTLLTGPANEKLEFKKYLDEHAKAVAAHIAAVETSDHPTDGELVRHARKHFIAAGQLHATRSP